MAKRELFLVYYHDACSSRSDIWGVFTKKRAEEAIKEDFEDRNAEKRQYHQREMPPYIIDSWADGSFTYQSGTDDTWFMEPIKINDGIDLSFD